MLYLIALVRLIKERDDKTWETHTDLKQLKELVFKKHEISSLFLNQQKTNKKTEVTSSIKRNYSIIYRSNAMPSIYNNAALVRLNIAFVRFKINWSVGNMLRLFIK